MWYREFIFKKINSYKNEHTIKYQEHVSNSIGAKLVCIDDRFTLPSIIFKGKSCVNEFMNLCWICKEELNIISAI